MTMTAVATNQPARGNRASRDARHVVTLVNTGCLCTVGDRFDGAETGVWIAACTTTNAGRESASADRATLERCARRVILNDLIRKTSAASDAALGLRERNGRERSATARHALCTAHRLDGVRVDAARDTARFSGALVAKCDESELRVGVMSRARLARARSVDANSAALRLAGSIFVARRAVAAIVAVARVAFFG